ncbi:protein PELPK1-like isoform X8 [Corvus moneduloides]|uniref:protein PELPK1-like isoform X8 n=1 Tax=Corvus moneduloides TaxID=1196302 RepID=UPI001363098D|nr:protein PELPK1-like isoform X8 [Corvus moneduloides]
MDTPGTRQEKSGRQEQVQHQEKFVYSQENNRNHPRTEGSTGLQCPRRAGNPSSTWECGMFLDWNVPELKELTKHQLLSWLCPRRKRPEARGKSGNEGHPEDQEGWALPPHLPSTARELLPAQHLSVLQNPPLGGRGCCRSIPNTQLRFPKIPHLEIPEPSQTLRFPKIPHLEIPDPSQTLRFPKIPHLEIPDSPKSPTWRSHSHPKHSDSQKSPTWRSQIPQNPPPGDPRSIPNTQIPKNPPLGDPRSIPNTQIPKNPPLGDPRSIPNTQIPKNPPLGDPRSIPNTQIPKNPPLGDPRSIPNTQLRFPKIPHLEIPDPSQTLRFPKIPHLEIPDPSQTLRFPKIPHLEIPDPSQTLRFPKIPHLEIPDPSQTQIPTWNPHSSVGRARSCRSLLPSAIPLPHQHQKHLLEGKILPFPTGIIQLSQEKQGFGGMDPSRTRHNPPGCGCLILLGPNITFPRNKTFFLE